MRRGFARHCLAVAWMSAADDSDWYSQRTKEFYIRYKRHKDSIWFPMSKLSSTYSVPDFVQKSRLRNLNNGLTSGEDGNEQIRHV